MFSPATKLKLETFAIVFGASFLSYLGAHLSGLSVGTVSWSAVISLVTAAVGSALQVAYSSFIQSALGNQLKGISSITLNRIKGASL